ncbi:MAG: TonB family protein [Gemmatimonadaceae bacterium]
MFNTLVESRATRTRSTKSTMMSVVLHGMVIAAAVSLTMTTPGGATIKEPKGPDLIYMPIHPKPPTIEPTVTPLQHQPAAPTTQFRTIVVPTITPTTLPPIDFTAPEVPADAFRIVAAGGGSTPYAPGQGNSIAPGSVVNSDAVERVPSLLGNARAPRYPDALRQSNIAGNVSVRFVVDTLGRAEMEGVTIVETSHPLFAEAVKNALLFYRFSPGEVGGHKVRTMVQIPFTFSLTK